MGFYKCGVTIVMFQPRDFIILCGLLILVPIWGSMYAKSPKYKDQNNNTKKNYSGRSSYGPMLKGPQ